MGVKSVVSSSQPEQNDLLCPVQFVEAVPLVVVWALLLPFFLGEGFDDGLFISVSGRSVLAGVPPWQAGLLAHFLGSHSVLESTARLGLSGLRGRPGLFPPH